jgi:hypothetical protein
MTPPREQEPLRNLTPNEMIVDLYRALVARDPITGQPGWLARTDKRLERYDKVAEQHEAYFDAGETPPCARKVRSKKRAVAEEGGRLTAAGFCAAVLIAVGDWAWKRLTQGGN